MTPSAGSATRSSRSTGALRWDRPTTRTLTCSPPRRGGGATLRCSWKARICSSMDMSTLRTSTWSGTDSTLGAKFRMLLTPAATSRSQTSWATCAGVAITPIATPRSPTTSSRSRQRHHRQPGDLGAHDRRVGVDQRPDREPARGEPAVVGQRVPEVAEPHDDDRPVLGQAQLAGDLEDQVVDVVADAPGAVGAEVGEVLAQLRRVDPGRGGELLRGDGRDAVLGQRAERPQVERQAGHGGVRHALAPRPWRRARGAPAAVRCGLVSGLVTGLPTRQ